MEILNGKYTLTVDLSKLSAASAFSGFKNSSAVSFQATIGTQSVLAGHFLSTTATTPLNNANSISQVQIQYGGLETFYRVVPGLTILRYPTYTTPNFEIGSVVYFSGGILNVFTYLANQTAGTIVVPDIIISCRAFLFIAPFNIS